MFPCDGRLNGWIEYPITKDSDLPAIRRGPVRQIVRQEKIGQHGKSSWAIELECGHIVNSVRRSSRDRRCCSQCVVIENTGPLETDYTRQRLLLASKLGVDVSQVEVSVEGARVSLLQMDVVKLLKG